MARAAAALDGAIAPADRVKMLREDAKEARERAKDESTIRENDAKARYYDSFSKEKDAKAAGAGTSDKPFKLDEDDKLRLKEASKGVDDATKAYQEALGKLMPGDKPEANPAVQFAANQMRLAKLNHLRTNIELGQITPESMATQIMGVAKNPQEVLKSLSELATVGGPEFSDKVAAQVQASDAWKRMNPQASAAPKTPAGNAMAKAPPGSVALRPDGSYGAPVARAAAAAGMPVAAGSSGSDPIEAVGLRLDAARAKLRDLRANAPGLAKGKAAVDQYAQTVAAARAEVQALEAEYERLVASHASPTFANTRPIAAQRGM
jgi:hypothetical protein